MFSGVNEAMQWVMSRRKSSYGNSRFREYLEYLGNPQLKLKCLHVAGTNGKGSTANYLRSILQKAGYKTGSFTSPHLMSHLDRIRINDENIKDGYFLKAVNDHQQDWEAYGLSMFEIDTVISFLYFLDEKVDWAVYEVGLGGRLDPTNVIKPLGAVITNIEMDHMELLGDTIEEIAREKAGIIKEGLPVVTFEKKPEALRVFREVCRQQGARLIRTREAENVVISNHIEYDYQSYHVTLPTTAEYQILNSSAAIALMRRLRRKGLVKLTKRDILEGLQTNWAGRYETVRENPKVILDGAHNENGIDALCNSLQAMKEDRVIVFSALKDKEYGRMLEKLRDQGELIITQFENSRAQSAQKLAEGLEDVTVIEDWKEAVDTALKRGKTVIITGSLYFISLVRERFVREKGQ